MTISTSASKTLIASALFSLLASCAEDATTRIPKISIMNPVAEGEATDAAFTINVSFEKVVVNDTWSLFYVSDATPASGAAIGESLPVTSRTLVWDTSLMPSGHYHLYAELKSLDSIVTSAAPGSLIVDHPVVDGNASAIVRLISPNGGEVLAPGETTSIAFSGSDSDGDALTYSLEISADDGATWTALVDGLTETAYEWAVPTDQPVGLTYRIRVKASDPSGATRSDKSDRPFAIL